MGGCRGPRTGIFLSYKRTKILFLSITPLTLSHGTAEVTARCRSLSGRASSPRNGNLTSEAKVLSQTTSHPPLEFAFDGVSFAKFLLPKGVFKSNGENVSVAASGVPTPELSNGAVSRRVLGGGHEWGQAPAGAGMKERVNPRPA